MRASNFVIATVKETPNDAVVESHKLLIRAGLIRKEAAGLYFLLPMGLRVFQKVENIIREEMNRAGAVEFLLPILTPSNLWQQSGRWEKMGPEMMRINDRHDADLVLGPTHEEAMTTVVSMILKSYRDLPKNVYQIHTKFRDEIRPRYGMIRSREFVMKDAYSFHADAEDLDREYNNMREAYTKIFERCGLDVVHVQADSGAMGGSGSEEFMVPSEIGEEIILTCSNCGYAGNQKKVPADYTDGETFTVDKPAEKVATPNVRSIEELEKFFELPATSFIKTLIYDSPGGPILIAIRGDRELNEVKLLNLAGENEVYPASDATIKKVTGCEPGFLGPVGLIGDGKDLRYFFDASLKQLDTGITGANEIDFHLTGVKMGDVMPKDAEFVDVSSVYGGDNCPNCQSDLNESRGIEVGHIFKLGDKYTKAFELTLLDPNGKPMTPTMGTYGIGVNRTMQTVIEQNWDENGIKFPKSVAPFEVVIVPISQKDEELAQVDELYEAMSAAGFDVILDDRKERPGFKFKDADLIGYPLRITVGKTFFGGDGEVEVKLRHEKEPQKIKVKALTDLIKEIPALLEKCP